jgi:hypothetical protein
MLRNFAVATNRSDWTIAMIGTWDKQLNRLLTYHQSYIKWNWNKRHTWRSLYDTLSIRYAVPHLTLLWSGILRGSTIPHSICSFSNASMRCPEDWICSEGRKSDGHQWHKKRRTLIASVRIAAITSKEPFSTRLSGSDGSYSQMAVVISTAAIFVMWSITSMFARLTTWPRQLEWY